MRWSKKQDDGRQAARNATERESRKKTIDRFFDLDLIKKKNSTSTSTSSSLPKPKTGLPQVLGHDPRLRDRRQDLLHRRHHGHEAPSEARLRRRHGRARDDDGAVGLPGVGSPGSDLEAVDSLGSCGAVLRVRGEVAVGGAGRGRRGE